jgi:putative NADH-flavin reductase
MPTQRKSQRIAVAGDSGRVGAPLVEILRQRGHEVVAIARSDGVEGV